MLLVLGISVGVVAFPFPLAEEEFAALVCGGRAEGAVVDAGVEDVNVVVAMLDVGASRAWAWVRRGRRRKGGRRIVRGRWVREVCRARGAAEELLSFLWILDAEKAERMDWRVRRAWRVKFGICKWKKSGSRKGVCVVVLARVVDP